MIAIVGCRVVDFFAGAGVVAGVACGAGFDARIRGFVPLLALASASTADFKRIRRTAGITIS